MLYRFTVAKKNNSGLCFSGTGGAGEAVMLPPDGGVRIRLWVRGLLVDDMRERE